LPQYQPHPRVSLRLTQAKLNITQTTQKKKEKKKKKKKLDACKTNKEIIDETNAQEV